MVLGVAFEEADLFLMFCSQRYPVDLAFCAYDAGVDEGLGVVVDLLTRFCAVGDGGGGGGV